MHKLTLLLALSTMICLPASGAGQSADATLPPGVDAFLKRYHAIISAEDAEGYKNLVHPNGFSSVPIAATIEGWKKYDPRPSVTNVELLDADAEMVILKVHTRTHFPEYPLNTRDASLMVLRKWESDWRLWHVSLLDSRKEG
ncbi:hypothetical protein AYO49_05225 [Verrucomicrobiaceae bacterium SCGC AG-212-N21]|nr:hypothetical protein AYO49_05225 [Verrucomicrobiaceae bacterium SCGC AG-212-N21]